MKKFLAENWLWIVLPMVLAAAVLAWLAMSLNDDDDVAPFIYNVGLQNPAQTTELAS